MESFNPRTKLQSQYEKDQAAAEAEAKAKKAIGGVKSVGKGAVTFADIEKWLDANPDEKYFRIDNGGKTVGEARSYTGKYGTWSDNDAAIVGQNRDKGARDIFRYANISAADVRTGKRGEKSTVGLQYSPSSFFKENSIEYNSSYGMVYSRDEYGALKNKAAKIGKSDRFLEAPVKKPTFSSDYGKDKGAILTGEGVDTNRRAGLGQDEASGLADGEDADNVTKRKLLG